MTQTPAADFKGRRIELKLPSSAQLLVWNHVAKQFEQIASLPEDQPLTAEMKTAQRKAMNRLSDLTFAVIKNEDDKEWLTDGILEERIVDTDLLELFTAFADAVQAAADQEDGGDEQGETSKPAPAKKTAAKKRSSAARVRH